MPLYKWNKTKNKILYQYGMRDKQKKYSLSQEELQYHLSAHGQGKSYIRKCRLYPYNTNINY